MRTNRAKRALENLGRQWVAEHQQTLDCVSAADSFQVLLGRAELWGGEWLTTIMDWTMPDEIIAAYHEAPADGPGPNTPYPLQNDWIRLNGVVSFLLIFSGLKCDVWKLAKGT
jgi:hypothetical protein